MPPLQLLLQIITNMSLLIFLLLRVKLPHQTNIPLINNRHQSEPFTTRHCKNSLILKKLHFHWQVTIRFRITFRGGLPKHPSVVSPHTYNSFD